MRVLQKESRQRPQEVEITYQYVNVNTDVEEVQITESTGKVYCIYRYTQTRYTHIEWTANIRQENIALKKSVSDLQDSIIAMSNTIY